MSSRIAFQPFPQGYPVSQQTAQKPESQPVVPMPEPQVAQAEAQPQQDQPSSPLKDQLDRGQQEADQLLEELKQAREAIEKHRESLKKLKTPVNYGDTAMTAYTKLNRARTKAEVSSAAGYARSQIVRLTAALRNADGQTQEIRAAIAQLKKAVGRAGKKRMDLDREALVARQRKAALQKRQARKAAACKQDLLKKRTARTFRENAYLHEAAISNYMAVHRDLAIEKYRAELSAITGGAEAGMSAASPGMGGISMTV